MKIAVLLLSIFALPGVVWAAPTRDREDSAGSCRLFPAGKRVVKLKLKPNTDIGDLVAWISSVTCKQFVLPGSISASSRAVTIISPQLITSEEAYRLFLTALESVGLTVYPTGRFLRIIEVGKASRSPIPVVLPGDGPAQEPGALLPHDTAREVAPLVRESADGGRGRYLSGSQTSNAVATAARPIL